MPGQRLLLLSRQRAGKERLELGTGRAFGGGLRNEQGTATLTNTTIRRNSADLAGGGVSNEQGSLTMAGGSIENTQSVNANDIMSLVGRFATGSGGK